MVTDKADGVAAWLSGTFFMIEVPPIPKKTKMRCFENYHLEERMNICEHYLNRLLVTPEICS